MPLPPIDDTAPAGADRAADAPARRRPRAAGTSCADTAPPIARRSMTPRPWLGFTRGLARAVPWRAGAAATPMQWRSAWQQAARSRRSTMLAISLALTAAATAALPDAAPGTSPLAHAVHAALFAVLFFWVSAGTLTALAGLWVQVRGDGHALKLPRVAPGTPGAAIAPDARTAVIMPICNEDLDTVFDGLQRTCRSLMATGQWDAFEVFVLSDTRDPALQQAEVTAWRALKQALGDAEGAGGRIHYRWRQRRSKRKAGNVADFCRRWGARYRYMVVLDADSVMSGEALVTMVRTMEAHPRVGILQTLPRSIGHDTLHARAQQFASRVTGRLFALGLAFWQLGESHYWGHNAILRVQPFMQHCGLAPIPGRGGLAGEILSHDFVEAALMRRAGYEVWLAPEIEGSWEQQPPHLLAELQRDRRWCQGNLQNARLLAEPGWRPVHRAMFFTGALSYLIAPLWLAFVILGATLAAATDGVGATGAGLLATAGAASHLWAVTLVLLLLPRVLGIGAVIARDEAELYGGKARLVASGVVEGLLSAAAAPIRMLAHSMFVIGALTGLKLEWKSPPRDGDALGWGDALRRVGPYALPALAAAWWWGLGDPWALMVLAPLLLAVPLVVWGSRASHGRALRRQRLLLVPEERPRVAAPAPATTAKPARRPAVRGAAPMLPTAGWVRPRRRAAGLALAIAPVFAAGVVGAGMMWPRALAPVPKPPSIVSEMDTRYEIKGVVTPRDKREARATPTAPAETPNRRRSSATEPRG